MFSALSLGSPIYILDKTSQLSYNVGELVGVSFPKSSYGQLQNTVDLKVKIGDTVQDFFSIPSINSVVTYNNGKVILSETKQGIVNEIENILLNSRSILNNIDSYKRSIDECESVLKDLNPQFAKDKERDEKLLSLENKFDTFESKLDKIFNLIQK